MGKPGKPVGEPGRQRRVTGVPHGRNRRLVRGSAKSWKFLPSQHISSRQCRSPARKAILQACKRAVAHVGAISLLLWTGSGGSCPRSAHELRRRHRQGFPLQVSDRVRRRARKARRGGALQVRLLIPAGGQARSASDAAKAVDPRQARGKGGDRSACAGHIWFRPVAGGRCDRDDGLPRPTGRCRPCLAHRPLRP